MKVYLEGKREPIEVHNSKMFGLSVVPREDLSVHAFFYVKGESLYCALFRWEGENKRRLIDVIRCS